MAFYPTKYQNRQGYKIYQNTVYLWTLWACIIVVWLNSHIIFEILVWGYECHQLEKTQICVIRITTVNKYNAHTEPLFMAFDLLKLKFMINWSTLQILLPMSTQQSPRLFVLISNYNTMLASPPPWWRHQMETFSALLAICAGNSPVSGEFPAQRPVTRSFDIFFDLRLNKQLSIQSWGWWFETLSCPLWCQCNGNSNQTHVYYTKTLYDDKRVRIYRPSESNSIPIPFYKNRYTQSPGFLSKCH